MGTPNKTLTEFLQEHNINILPEFNKGTLRAGSQWGIFKEFQYQGHTMQTAHVGDWKHDVKAHWNTGLNGLGTDEDAQRLLQEHLAKAREEFELEKARIQGELAPLLEREWEEFSDRAPPTPYLRRKNIDSLHGCRVAPNEKGDPILIVPMRDADGKFWNYQRIFSDKLSRGDKFFKKGARIDGTFHALGEPATSDTLYLCEGIATACSIYMALKDRTVVCCFNAGNLVPVARALYAKYPSARFVICADDDCYNHFRDGRPNNAGWDKAADAARECGGIRRKPTFKRPQKGLTDFNDLHCAQGLDEVSAQILEAKSSNEVEQIFSKPDGGKVGNPSEKILSDVLLAHFGDKVIREHHSLFLFSGTHWVEQDKMGEDRIKQMIGKLGGPKMKAKDINQAFSYFFMHCPQVPRGVSLFQPNPYTANFLDGTLHLIPDGLKYRLETRAHSRDDFLTSVLPFNQPPPDRAPPTKFTQMLEDLWSTNPDKKEVHMFVQELFGACLCPAFPIIALFQGKPNTGKSTIIKLLVHLVSRENTSNVQPCDFVGFGMETMIGKLLNYDTDIDVNKPMVDSEIKKIIDRVPRTIRRKGIKDVQAFIPAVHLFAGNDLPRSLDGSSHAYGRRLVVVKTESFDGTTGVRDFEKILLEEEGPAIVGYAIEGLRRLAETAGTFTIPQSSRDAVQDMEDESDIAKVFLDEVKAEEIYAVNNEKLLIGKNLKILRPKLWIIFNDWQGSFGLVGQKFLSRTLFYRRMESMGYCVHKVGQWYFTGIGTPCSGGPGVQGNINFPEGQTIG